MAKVAEDQLIVRLRAGENQAVTEWYQVYVGHIQRQVAAKVAIKEDAEELVQEVFIACLRELVHFRGESSLKTWMLTIARHKIADYYRARYAKKVIHLVALFEGLTLPSTSQVKEQVELVQQTLARLNPAHQELLLAKYVDGKSVRQLAAELATTVKTVESQLFRARNEFRYQFTFVSQA